MSQNSSNKSSSTLAPPEKQDIEGSSAIDPRTTSLVETETISSPIASPKNIRGKISTISSTDGSIVNRVVQTGSTGVSEWNVDNDDSSEGRGQSKFFALVRHSNVSTGQGSVNRSGDLRPSSNRTMLARLTNTNTGEKRFSASEIYKSRMAAAQIFRGYSIGDYALVMNKVQRSSIRRQSLSFRDPETSKESASEKYLVNKHGYPKGKGKSQLERKGPYSYVLCTITKAHYEENEVYWTVTREDNDEEMRGDARNMEPIVNQEGLLAAQLAALWSREINENDDQVGDLDDFKSENNLRSCLTACLCITFCLPVICFRDCLSFVRESKVYKTLLRHAKMFLDGREPYRISCRITSLKVIVVCSIWYLFIDQIQLAFIPPSADKALAWVNFAVWLVLMMELVVGVFVRPGGWNDLVRSDKAYTPKTASYIGNIHLCVEMISLLLFIPVFYCIFSSESSCSDPVPFSLLEASLAAVIGPTVSRALYGRFFYGIIRFRVFSVVRHWRNLWMRNTFVNYKKLKTRRERRRRALLYGADEMSTSTIDTSDEYETNESSNNHVVPYGQGEYSNTLSAKQISLILATQEGKDREEARVKASNIGTALMTVNSHRALCLFCFLTACFPMVFLFNMQNVVNPASLEMVEYLQAINVQVPEDANDNSIDCDYLYESVEAWSKAMVQFDPAPLIAQTEEQKTAQQNTEANIPLISVSIRPPRCYEKFNNTIVGKLKFNVGENCPSWSFPDEGFQEECIYGITVVAKDAQSLEDVATTLAVRVGSMETFQDHSEVRNSTFAVSATYNHTDVVRYGARYSFILESLLVIITIVMLNILRKDTVNLVFGSLRSMLRIVLRYAKNPLSPPERMEIRHNDGMVRGNDSGVYDSVEEGDDDEQLNRTYETEQLVTAVTKITDLLRKCWGVAGADIISTNLASTDGTFDVFNPTVPGRNVFALFAFAAITDFDFALKNLGGDVMILINDVASVLHGQVYRWGLGDSGQCNRNLGSAFFMVFKIGSVTEVVEKLEEARQVVFSTATGKKASRKKSLRTVLDADKDVAMEAMAEAMQLSLEQIPGISTFADRAVVGMLKSFASMQRDSHLRAWSQDFRLSDASNAWSVNMIFGMDAGWAIEGAVGSEYKIDATYLSPHVNMASRMMSACKQYGVTILLSEAVHELLSEPGKAKMRNIDRVTVKGSSKVQNIYTYDARTSGSYLFLYGVTDEQADQQAKNYDPSIWNFDMDLKVMRHHITDDFEQEFYAGMKAYYAGDWPTAIEKLERANDIMVQTAMEEGDLGDDIDNSPEREELYRRETSDAPSLYLINFMKSRGGKAPDDWDGWHPLMSK